MMDTDRSRTPLVITHEGGMRFAAQIRGHRVLVDQPAHAGGEDSAPMPIELLGASLGTCIAYYIHQFCESRALPHAGLRVEVTPHCVTNPSRIGDFAVHVHLPATLTDMQLMMLERVARSCPVGATLERGSEMTLQLDVGSRDHEVLGVKAS